MIIPSEIILGKLCRNYSRKKYKLLIFTESFCYLGYISYGTFSKKSKSQKRKLEIENSKSKNSKSRNRIFMWVKSPNFSQKSIFLCIKKLKFQLEM